MKVTTCNSVCEMLNKLVLLALGLDARRTLVVELLHVRNSLLQDLLVALCLVLALCRQLLRVLLLPLTVCSNPKVNRAHSVT